MTRKRNGDYRVKDDAQFVIYNDGDDEIGYLHSHDGHGPVVRSTPKTFTRRGADNLMAQMRNAGMLVGDFTIARF